MADDLFNYATSTPGGMVNNGMPDKDQEQAGAPGFAEQATAGFKLGRFSTSSVMDELARGVSDLSQSSYIGVHHDNAPAPVMPNKLSADTLNALYPGDTPFTEPMYDKTAQLVRSQQDKRKELEATVQLYNNAYGAPGLFGGIAGGLVGGLSDPLNVAAMAISSFGAPIAGAVTGAERLGAAISPTAEKLFSSVAAGATSMMKAQAPALAVNLTLGRKDVEGGDWRDALKDYGEGAVAGAAFNTVFHLPSIIAVRLGKSPVATPGEARALAVNDEAPPVIPPGGVDLSNITTDDIKTAFGATLSEAQNGQQTTSGAPLTRAASIKNEIQMFVAQVKRVNQQLLFPTVGAPKDFTGIEPAIGTALDSEFAVKRLQLVINSTSEGLDDITSLVSSLESQARSVQSQAVKQITEELGRISDKQVATHRLGQDVADLSVRAKDAEAAATAEPEGLGPHFNDAQHKALHDYGLSLENGFDRNPQIEQGLFDHFKNLHSDLRTIDDLPDFAKKYTSEVREFGEHHLAVEPGSKSAYLLLDNEGGTAWGKYQAVAAHLAEINSAYKIAAAENAALLARQDTLTYQRANISKVNVDNGSIVNHFNKTQGTYEEKYTAAQTAYDSLMSELAQETTAAKEARIQQSELMRLRQKLVAPKLSILQNQLSRALLRYAAESGRVLSADDAAALARQVTVATDTDAAMAHAVDAVDKAPLPFDKAAEVMANTKDQIDQAIQADTLHAQQTAAKAMKAITDQIMARLEATANHELPAFGESVKEAAAAKSTLEHPPEIKTPPPNEETPKTPEALTAEAKAVDDSIVEMTTRIDDTLDALQDVPIDEETHAELETHRQAAEDAATEAKTWEALKQCFIPRGGT